MEQCDPIGARLDRLPLSRFHFRIFGIISFSLLITGFLSYSGNVVLAKLVSNGWSNNYLNAAFTSALMFGYFIGSLTGGLRGGASLPPPPPPRSRQPARLSRPTSSRA